MDLSDLYESVSLLAHGSLLGLWFEIRNSASSKPLLG